MLEARDEINSRCTGAQDCPLPTKNGSPAKGRRFRDQVFEHLTTYWRIRNDRSTILAM